MFHCINYHLKWYLNCIWMLLSLCRLVQKIKINWTRDVFCMSQVCRVKLYKAFSFNMKMWICFDNKSQILKCIWRHTSTNETRRDSSLNNVDVFSTIYRYNIINALPACVCYINLYINQIVVCGLPVIETIYMHFQYWKEIFF